MSEEIRPCPFCGSRDVHEYAVGPYDHGVECCDCSAQTGSCDSRDEAIAAWNGRAPRADVLASADASFYGVSTNFLPGLPEASTMKAEVQEEGHGHCVEFDVDPETAARIVTAKGLRLLLVEGGDDE